MSTRIKKYFSGLSKSTIYLALTSLFADISTEMLYPVLPIYLTENLKASGSIVGLIEGIAVATQNIVQGLSGYLSDKLQGRKIIALCGYLLSAISKPFIGIFGTWPGVMVARISDRVGAGTRSAPRDALIASSVEEKDKGKAFGLEGIGDNSGAFIGPLITVLLFFTLNIDIHYIFFLSVIPASLTVLMLLLVIEKKTDVKSKSRLDLNVRNFPKEYWKFLLVIAFACLGNSSSSFIILLLKEKGFTLISTVLIYAFFNLAAAIISYPAGSLSDKFGRKPLLLISFLIFLCSYIGFSFSPDSFVLAILFIFYGLYQGIFRSVGKTFAADFVPESMRASGIGWYSAIVGFSSLFASIVAGQLWDKINHNSVFIYGAICSFTGTLLLLILIPKEPFRSKA